jgi:hypothetical protein
MPSFLTISPPGRPGQKRNGIHSRLKHKGHPLCNLALIGQAIGSPSLTRHYALLSSAGDVYWQHKHPALKDGGLAPTLVERTESREKHYAWRQSVGALLGVSHDKPIYLESLLASQWFSESRSKHITELSNVIGNRRRPFVEVLLDSVENPNDTPPAVTGTRFEAAVGLILSSTPGFEVDKARQRTDEQVDLVVNHTAEPLARIGVAPGLGLVECKASAGAVSSKELRDFGAKCLFHRVKFGILAARAKTTGSNGSFENAQNAELVRRRFQLDGLTLLVLSMGDLRDKCRSLRGVLGSLEADYKELVFGPES